MWGWPGYTRSRPAPRPASRPDPPALGATPAPADLQISGRVPLALEAAAPHEGDRRAVARLDVGLEPVEPHRRERVANHQPQRLAHVTLAREGGHGTVAEVGALERAPDDLGDVEPADDGRVLPAAGEKALVAVFGDPLEIGAVALARERRVEPGSVQAAARSHQGEKLVLVGGCRRAEEHARRHSGRPH